MRTSEDSDGYFRISRSVRQHFRLLSRVVSPKSD